MVNGEVTRCAGCKSGRESEGVRSRFIGYSQAAQPPTSPFTSSRRRTGNVS